MTDPLAFAETVIAETLRAATGAAGAGTLASGAGSMGASGAAVGGMQNFVNFVLARRPVWLAQEAANAFAARSATTAPIWRWVRVPGPLYTQAVRGTSMAATMSGVGGLALTAGVPIAVAIGTWIALGSGYAAARKKIRRDGFMTGYSRGFVMGVLKWHWQHAVDRFGMRYVIRKNVWDGEMDRQEALGNNEGLRNGYAAGDGVPETWYDKDLDKVVDKKKAYRIALRKAAGITAAGEWSRNWDEARLQQRNYVVELAAKGLKSGLIVPE